jgi:DNA polymerase eta
MKGEEAKKMCAEQGHDLALIQVPVRHNKNDMKIYRDAGAEVVRVLSRIASECHSGKCEIERASIDEVGKRVCVKRACA